MAVREGRFPLAGAAPATIQRRMSAFTTCGAYDVVVHGTVIAESFPVPLASSPSRAEPTRTPTCANALHGRSWVIFFLEHKPVRVYPFEQPVDSDKVSFLNDDSVNFALPAWRCLRKCRRKHGGEVL